MNNVNIIGRVASDPLKFHIDQFNKDVIKFALAFDNRTRKTDGVKDTFFIECEAWDDVGHRIYDACKRGDKIGIAGHLEQAKFVRKDGSKGSMIKLIVSVVDFLFDKRETTPKELESIETSEEEEVVEDDALPF